MILTPQPKTAASKIHETYSLPIRQCLHYIHQHLHNKITVATLATVCNLSVDYCSLLFKKEVGKTISSYIRTAKLEATKVLLTTNCNYSTICYNYGFCSESYYIACFKKEYGVTPREYVASHT
ncbi:helix-turn-helix domain-containing protein [Anaerosporobacter faecicola]|uniref:helix-turn-helix domain-containing protein n=1 Tax=Anaerosporobacter faecicola TaxID=2718714 RepID=UPI00143CA430|nr:AraC family transcriptional regulator [Anaerosporobacter faecicola]